MYSLGTGSVLILYVPAFSSTVILKYSAGEPTSFNVEAPLISLLPSLYLVNFNSANLKELSDDAFKSSISVFYSTCAKA